MQAKTGYHHGDLANALLDAADRLLEEQGLAGFTLRACARLAGVSHAAPKHHFQDVNGLLAAVAERGFARLVSALQTALKAAKGDLEAELYATMQAYVGFADAYPEHFRIMFRSDLVGFDMSCPPASVLDTFTELTNVILRQRGEPEISHSVMGVPKEAALVNDILLGWCHIHGYTHLRLEGQLTVVPDGTHEVQLRRASKRLSALIRERADHQNWPD